MAEAGTLAPAGECKRSAWLAALARLAYVGV
jgi:hypothetical protein